MYKKSMKVIFFNQLVCHTSLIHQSMSHSLHRLYRLTLNQFWYIPLHVARNLNEGFKLGGIIEIYMVGNRYSEN